MFTTNPLLDGIFRKKKTTRRRAASVTDLPDSMTEAEAEAWMDSTIGKKDVLYGEEFRPFTRLNWSYGKTLRDGLKSMLYRVEVDKESVAEMKKKLRVFHTGRNHWMFILPDGEFLIEMTRFLLNRQFGPPVGHHGLYGYGSIMGKTERLNMHIWLVIDLMIVLYLYGVKMFIAVLLNGAYCQESFAALTDQLSNKWTLNNMTGHSILGYSMHGLFCAAPKFAFKTDMFTGGWPALVSFLRVAYVMLKDVTQLLIDPPRLNADRGWIKYFDGAIISHTAHVYGFLNGATLPVFITAVESIFRKV